MLKRSYLSLVAIIVLSHLGCCMELDISIPSFPSIMIHFGATEAQVQNTLSLNFLAFCLSGLFYGPLSEAWGRRGLMLVGATLFLVGALGCVFSGSIYQLMFWRFIQGLGASSTFVLGFAMISDTYSKEEAGYYIGKMNAYVTFCMAAAPILGSFIINYFTWQANFTVIAAIALIAWIAMMTQLPETWHKRQPLSLVQILKDYGSLIINKEFMLLSAIPNLLVTAYLTFVGSAAFYYINTCELSYFEFALQQGLVVVTFSITSFYSGSVIAKIGSQRAVHYGMMLAGLSTVFMLFFAYAFPTNPWLITFAMSLFALGCAFPMSVVFAQSLDVVPSLRGTSSSFIMSTRLLLSSIAIAATGMWFDGTMKPVALVNAIATGMAVILYFAMNSRKERQQMVVT